MKKVFKIVGILLLVIILLMIAIPFLFKGKIKDAVINAANEQLNAKISIGDFGLNLFSNFPDATLSLQDAIVSGVGSFENDTLLQAQSASVTIDLMSLFGSNYNISKINLDKTAVYAKILADGQANWDIMKATPDDTVTPSDDESSSFNLNLKEISVTDCSVIFQNDSTNMKLILTGWNGTVSGDFSANETTLATSSTIDEISFIMDKIPYISKAKGVAEAKLNANFDNMKFTFIDSDIKLNDLSASIDGSIAMVGEEGMDFDLKLLAPNTEFKQILSIVPAMYTDDFKNIKTSGSASLDASVKGLMEGENYPAFDVKIAVKDAMFQYPSLPKSVDNINVDLAVNSKGGSLDNTVVDISKFMFTLGGNPFSAKLNITTPMSDPNLKLSANGTLDLGMIREVYPLEKGTELNGKIVADMSLATRMSAIEKEQYENVSAAGNLNLTNMVYKADDMPDVLIDKAGLEFTPKYVNLSSLNVKIGKNDIAATGRLENFIAYALKDQTLKGQLAVFSNYFNANDFISDEPVADTESADEVDIFKNKIIIPKNLDFNLNANMKHVVYDKINITNMAGGMSIKNGVLSLNNVNANALGGSCKITGSYDTSNPDKPLVNFAINLSNVSFAETFKSVETIQKFAPIFDNLVGTYSMNLNFNTSLGASLLETLAGLAANGALQTSDVKIENNSTLNALASALKVDGLKTISPKNLNIPFSVDNGRIMTKPFSVNIGDGGDMKLEGSTGLDQTINYKGTITLPKSLSNNYIKNVPLTIGGTFTSPKIGVDTKGLAQGAIDNVTEQLLGGSVDEKKAELGAKINEEKLKQAQKIREEAKNTSDKLVKAAEEQAQKLESEAKNALAKAGAQVAGKKLVEEAKKQGQNLIDKAEEQARKLEAEAQPAE